MLLKISGCPYVFNRESIRAGSTLALRMYCSKLLRTLASDNQWESFLLLKLISCPMITPDLEGRKSIAPNWSVLYAVGVVSQKHDISLPDKRLAPRVLLRQDSFMALNQGRFMSVFRVGQCQHRPEAKIMLKDCDLQFTLLDNVRARQTFVCKLSEFNRHLGRGTPVLPSQGDLIIVAHNSQLEAKWPFFVIRSCQHAWNRSVLMLDTRFVSQRYEFDRSFFESFVASFENQHSPDVQEKFLMYFQSQPAEIQEYLMRVSFDRISDNDLLCSCLQTVFFLLREAICASFFFEK